MRLGPLLGHQRLDRICQVLPGDLLVAGLAQHPPRPILCGLREKCSASRTPPGTASSNRRRRVAARMRSG
ncbi:MAG: hypothetical protein ACRDL7_04870 [Gaiellaceae bacterium]